MKTSFIFPGQGSQYIGMGSDWYKISETAKSYYNSANEILGFDIAEISFSAPNEILKKTIYTQPAIFIHSIIIDEHLKQIGYKPDSVAGHSLGEFAALVSAEIINFEDALKIVKIRSQSMMESNNNQNGAMAAIMGANEMQINIICNQNGIVVPANINAPKQIVISGEKNAIDSAIITAKKLGLRRAIRLNVSGAFHSPLMKSARDSLASIINSVNFNIPKIPIYQNVNAKASININEIKNNLIKQLEHPVLWMQTIKNMISDDTQVFYEVGPGKVLTGLNKRINDTINSQSFDKADQISSNEIL